MNPWIVIRIQVVKRQHRGAAHSRQYGLSGEISLLSLAYLHSIMNKFITQILFGHYGQLNYIKQINITKLLRNLLIFIHSKVKLFILESYKNNFLFS